MASSARSGRPSGTPERPRKERERPRPGGDEQGEETPRPDEKNPDSAFFVPDRPDDAERPRAIRP